MASTNRVSVQSSKKSTISKVEVITVNANNVHNVGSTHPVAVVIAEKLCPAAKSQGWQKEPKKVFVPGCPVPQILPPELENDLSTNDYVKDTKSHRYHKSFRPNSKKVSSDRRKISKAVTFKIDDGQICSDENVRTYHPKVYKSCKTSYRSEVLNPTAPSGTGKTFRNNQPFSELEVPTEVPYFVLPSRGLDYKYNSTLSNDDFIEKRNTDSSCVCISSSECSCIPTSSEDIQISESDTENLPSYSGGMPEISVKNGCNFVKMKPKGEMVSGEPYRERSNVEIVSDGTSSKHIPVQNELQLQGDKVNVVKSGSLHIRQRPHVLETKREYNKEKYTSCNVHIKSKGLKESALKCPSVPFRENIFPMDSSIGVNPSVSNKRCLQKTSMEKEKKHGTQPPSFSIRSSRLKVNGNGFSDGVKRSPMKVVKPSSGAKHQPPSQMKELSSETPVGGVSRSSGRDPLSQLSPLPENFQSVFPLSLPELDSFHKKLGSVKENQILHFSSKKSNFDESFNLEDYASFAKWAEKEQDNLQQYVSSLQFHENSKLSSILQELSKNTFDEHKYFLSKRVESYISGAYSSASNHLNGNISTSISSKNYVSSAPPFQSILTEKTKCLVHESRYGIPTTAVVATTEQSGPHESEKYFCTRPPPLFTHHWQSNKTSRCIPFENDHLAYGRHSKQKYKGKSVKAKPRGYEKKREREEKKLFADEDGKGTECRLPENLSSAPKVSVNKLSPKLSGKRPHLEFTHQKHVNIAPWPVTEKVAVISIPPESFAPQRKKKHRVIEAIHQSSEVSSYNSEEDKDDGTGGQRSESIPVEETKGNDCSLHKHSVSLSSDQYHCQLPGTRKESAFEDDKSPQRGVDSYSSTISDSEMEEHVPELDFEGGGRCSDEDGSEEAENLPGHMPQVRWQEVALSSRSVGDTENLRQGRLQEAEDRLFEHDVREQILHRLENRLRQMAFTGEVNSEEMAESTSNNQHSSDVIHDEREQMSSAALMMRKMLINVVQEKIKQIPHQETSMTSESSQTISSPVSGSVGGNLVDQSISIPTPQDSSRLQQVEGSHRQVVTPSLSPPLPQRDIAVGSRHVTTPENSLEEHDDIHSEEVIATPRSSPPLSTSPNAPFPSATPAVTPDSSPKKISQAQEYMYAGSTPDGSPAASPKKIQPSSLITTPVVSPTSSPGKSRPRYPKVDSPNESPPPSHRKDRVASTDRIASTPNKTPSPYKEVKKETTLPKTPPPSTSLVNVQVEPFTGQSSSEEVHLAKATESSESVVTPTYSNLGIQVDMNNTHKSSKADKAVLVKSKTENQMSIIDDSLSVICHSSADVTLSPTEVSDATCYTMSEGEVLIGHSSVNISMEDGELARTCHLNVPHRNSTSVCLSHMSSMSRPKEDHRHPIMSESEELQFHESGEYVPSFLNRQVSSPALDTSEDIATSTKVDASEMSLVQTETYSSGVVTAVSEEKLSALRQENAVLLHRLDNFGSFRFLCRDSPTTGSSSSEASEPR